MGALGFLVILVRLTTVTAGHAPDNPDAHGKINLARVQTTPTNRPVNRKMMLTAGIARGTLQRAPGRATNHRVKQFRVARGARLAQAKQTKPIAIMRVVRGISRIARPTSWMKRLATRKAVALGTVRLAKANIIPHARATLVREAFAPEVFRPETVPAFMALFAKEAHRALRLVRKRHAIRNRVARGQLASRSPFRLRQTLRAEQRAAFT